jgi:hypothetical protein
MCHNLQLEQFAIQGYAHSFFVHPCYWIQTYHNNKLCRYKCLFEDFTIKEIFELSVTWNCAILEGWLIQL